MCSSIIYLYIISKNKQVNDETGKAFTASLYGRHGSTVHKSTVKSNFGKSGTENLQLSSTRAHITTQMADEEPNLETKGEEEQTDPANAESNENPTEPAQTDAANEVKKRHHGHLQFSIDIKTTSSQQGKH